jgi:formate dehydrogenase subunit beta
MSNEMFIARATRTEMLESGKSNGVVTSVLKSALKAGIVDGVVATCPVNGDRFSGIPVLITEPDDLDACAGSLHCSIPNLSRFVKEYLDGSASMRLAIVGKPCDLRGIIELQKRHQIDVDNVYLIGLNCTGTISPGDARRICQEELKIDHRDILYEDIDEGQLVVTMKDGSKKELDLWNLEETKGYGRRDNCRRCEYNIPTFADLAFGKWGTEESKDGGVFVEVCSSKGKNLLAKAQDSGAIKVENASKKAISLRTEKDSKELERAKWWREHDFKPILEMPLADRLEYWIREFSKCIKCYGCRDACPICYCENCLLEATGDYLGVGRIPPDATFPLTRLAHVADSCVACGQCQDACPMELPLTKMFTLLNSQLNEIFKYEPGVDVEEGPPLSTARPEEMRVDDTFLDLAALLKRATKPEKASE